MNKKSQQEFILLFNQAFEEVVLPEIEEIRDDIKGVKEDIKGVKEDIKGVKNRVDSIDLKLDRGVDNQLEDRSKLSDHEKRIKKLETRTVLS